MPIATVDSTKKIVPIVLETFNNAFQYNYLSFKSKCDYKDPNLDQSFTMNFRIKRDSIIWISITAVGFEVARAKLDIDSVRVISRLEKKYYTYSYDYVKNLTGTKLSLNQIQNLLTANLLFLPENYYGMTEKNKMKITEGYIENVVVIDEKSKIIEQVLNHLVEKSSANIIYSNFKKSDKQSFPGNLDISIVTSKSTISMLMENSSINTDVIELFPFEISSKYVKGH